MCTRIYRFCAVGLMQAKNRADFILCLRHWAHTTTANRTHMKEDCILYAPRSLARARNRNAQSNQTRAISNSNSNGTQYNNRAAQKTHKMNIEKDKNVYGKKKHRRRRHIRLEYVKEIRVFYYVEMFEKHARSLECHRCSLLLLFFQYILLNIRIKYYIRSSVCSLLAFGCVWQALHSK